MRQRLPFLILCSAIAGCAGAAPPVSVAGADTWAPVTKLDRPADVVVHVDPSAVAAATERFESTADADVYRIEGTLADATDTGLLLRGGSASAGPIEIARTDVVRIFVLEQESRWGYVLIGSVAGFGVCVLGGLLGETDVAFMSEPRWATVCAGGGAGIGFLANRDPATLQLVYERPERPARWTP